MPSRRYTVTVQGRLSERFRATSQACPSNPATAIPAFSPSPLIKGSSTAC